VNFIVVYYVITIKNTLHFQQSDDGKDTSSATCNATTSATPSARVTPRNRPLPDETHIGKYRLIKTIGKGNFAKVKLARHMPTEKEVV
jgi:serine/threonine protein kinase